MDRPQTERSKASGSAPTGEEGVWVALGSNLGDRAAHLSLALSRLDATPGVVVRSLSSVYETDPVGPPPQGAYLNAVAGLSTTLSPRALLDRLLSIEREAGRDRGEAAVRWGARTLDLDLLLYGESQLNEPDLEIPHPRLHERAFVLEPLCDVAPDLVHPRLGCPVAEIAERVRDRAAVRRWSGTLAYRLGLG